MLCYVCFCLGSGRKWLTSTDGTIGGVIHDKGKSFLVFRFRLPIRCVIWTTQKFILGRHQAWKNNEIHTGTRCASSGVKINHVPWYRTESENHRTLDVREELGRLSWAPTDADACFFYVARFFIIFKANVTPPPPYPPRTPHLPLDPRPNCPPTPVTGVPFDMFRDSTRS